MVFAHIIASHSPAVQYYPIDTFSGRIVLGRSVGPRTDRTWNRGWGCRHSRRCVLLKKTQIMKLKYGKESIVICNFNVSCSYERSILPQCIAQQHRIFRTTDTPRNTETQFARMAPSCDTWCTCRTSRLPASQGLALDGVWTCNWWPRVFQPFWVWI